MRGKRGLNHVHVGSLHAADDEMALQHARDVYTRRNEGVSIWVVARRRHHRVQPGREGPALRAERRQGLPAPDVLRHPRRRPAHVRSATDDRRRRAPSYEALTEAARRRRAGGRSAPASTTRWPASTRPSPTASTPADLAAYCLMLGDDALVCAQRLPSGAAARRSSRRRSRWPTSRSTCSARPGCCWPGPAQRRTGRRPPDRGRARLLPRRPTSSATSRSSRRRTATSRTTIARLLLFSTVAARAARAAARRPATRCSPRSPPRASRSWPTTATTPRRWVLRLGDGTEVSHRRMQAALDAVWPLRRRAVPHDPTSRPRLPGGGGVDPADVRGEVDAVLDAGARAQPR